MLGSCPHAEFAEEFCEGGGLVVGVEAAGVGEDPGVAAAEGVFLEADAGVFDAGDDAVGADADEGDDGGAPAFDFGFETLAAGAKFVVGEFIGAGREFCASGVGVTVTFEVGCDFSATVYVSEVVPASATSVEPALCTMFKPALSLSVMCAVTLEIAIAL